MFDCHLFEPFPLMGGQIDGDGGVHREEKESEKMEEGRGGGTAIFDT